MAEAPVRVSEFVHFQWRDGKLICDHPLRHRQVALNPDAERLLRPFATWRPAREAEAIIPGGQALVDQMLAAGVLIAQGSAEHRLESAATPWHAIGTHARQFHLSTRTHAGDHFLTAAEDAQRLRAKLASQPAPGPYKEYPSSRRVRLPARSFRLPRMDFAEVLRRRRTVRRLDPHASLTTHQLGALLRWTAGALYEVDTPPFGTVLLKASPSGGARHPIELYPVIRSVSGIQPGIYHYNARTHELEALGGPVDAATLVNWCGGQLYVANASALLLQTAVLERTVWKYSTSRAYRAMLLDAGHLSQTAYLVATALELGVFFTAATRDEAVEQALGISWTSEIFLGVTGVGLPTAEESLRCKEMRQGATAGISHPHDAWDGRVDG